MLASLSTKRIAQSAWEGIKSRRVGVHWVRESNIEMLQVVPDHLEQVTISIETLLDVNDLTVEEVTGRLRNVEQRKKNTISAVDKEGVVYSSLRMNGLHA